MADTPTNTNQLNAFIDALIARMTDVEKAQLGMIDAGNSGELGSLALFNRLSDAPIGDAAAVRAAIKALTAGDFGLGSTNAPSVNDPDQITNTGFFTGSGSSATELPADFRFSTILACLRGENVNLIYIAPKGSGSSEPVAGIQAYYDGSFGPCRNLLTNGNTTTDSNGFIKAASPIFRLANHAEYASGDGFTLDGCGAYNGEAEGVTATHDETGVYTVSGSLGFAGDGWTIEIPQDVNGNRLCFVETETANDGTITVRTFGRRFDYETAMIVAGDPIDIPDGRWIDLRLAMPEPEQPEDDDAAEQEPTE
ncbi:phage tail fiber protein [Salinicola sp. V024]|uniref:phage tail fiber protein n=1 Tax=Salinicola sp. V024 TaxID=3459609 RepID=UPI004044CDEC